MITLKRNKIVNSMDSAENAVSWLRENKYYILSFGSYNLTDQYELIYINSTDEISIVTDNKEVYLYILRNAPQRKGPQD